MAELLVALAPYKDFGLGAFISLVLLYIMFQAGKGILLRVDRMLESHKEERKEWRTSEDNRTDKLSAALNELSESIKNRS